MSAPVTKIMDSPPSSQASAQNLQCPYISVGKVLSWGNPTVTMMALATINMTFMLVWLFNLSLVSIGCYVGLTLLFAGLMAALIMPASAANDSRLEVISKAQAEEHLIVFYDGINKIARESKDIVLWRHMGASMKAGVCLFVLSFIASWFSFSFLLFLGVNMSFFVPQINSAYDRYVAPIMRQASKTVKSRFDKIPRMTAPPSHAKAA